MVTLVHESDQVTVPAWVTDLDAFRRWAHSDDFPEQGRIWYLKGEVWVDMSKEQIFSHIAVKTEFTTVVGGLVRSEDRGYYLTDGLFVTNDEAGLGGNPDGTYVSYRSLQSGRARLIRAAGEGYIELEGAADMQLEIVSNSSVSKDNRVLREAYWEAGVREYWLVDARRDPLTFDILRHTVKGYSTVRKRDGWQRSAVFGKEFRLERRTDRLGHPGCTLLVR